MSDPSALVITFGKHKGMTVAELVTRDPDYVEWLLGQGWLAERFAELHAALLTRGVPIDDTPEHNAIQVRFLKAEFCIAFYFALSSPERREFVLNELPSIMEERRKVKVTAEIEGHRRWLPEAEAEYRRWPDHQFYRERLDNLRGKLAKAEAALADDLTVGVFLEGEPKIEQRGIDVVFSLLLGASLANDPWWTEVYYQTGRFTIEIKPSLGDDFPGVMRQMEQLGALELLVGSYCGRGAALEQVREVYRGSGYKLVMLQEVEAELPYAREMIRRQNQGMS